MASELRSRPVAAPREAHSDRRRAQVDEREPVIELRGERAQLLVARERGRMVDCPGIGSPDVEQPVLVDVVDRRRMRRHEHPKRLVQEVADVGALVEDHGRVVAEEEHRRRLGVIRRQVDDPEVAEAVPRDRKSAGERLRCPDRQAPPGEVDRLERPAVDPCRTAERPS